MAWEKTGRAVAFGALDPKRVELTPDGGIVVGGYGVSGPRVDRYDGGGNALWTRLYHDSAGDWMTLQSLIPTADGGSAFCGRVLRGATAPQPLVVKLDPDGNVEWATEYEIAHSPVNGTGLDLLETADGSFVVVGEATYSDDASPAGRTINSLNAFCMKLDADGEVIFSKVYGGIGYDRASAAAEGADGTLALVGSVALETHPSWILGFDGAGSILWSLTRAGSCG